MRAHQVGQFMSEQAGTHSVCSIIDELREQNAVPPHVSKKRLQNLKSEYTKKQSGGGRIG